MTPTVSVDCARFPIVVMTFVGTPTMEELEAALREFDEILRRRERYVLVMDVSRMGIITAALRHRSARWLIENGPSVVACCIGVVCVATTPLARAALAAMEWLDPRGDKYVIVKTLDEALRRAGQRLGNVEPDLSEA